MHKRLSQFFFICFISCIYKPAHAQNDSVNVSNKGNALIKLNRKIIRWIIKEPKPFYDTNYVKLFTRVFTVGGSLSSKKLKMGFQEVSSEHLLQYHPSNIYSPGIFVNTSLLGFSITPSFLGIHQNSKKKGSSDFNDYQFHIYAKRFFYDISLQLYSGFYLNNTQDYKEYEQLENYYKRKDISAISGNFNIYYVFNNRKFSFRAPFSFTQSQIKSAGSFITGTYLSDFAFTADSSVIGASLSNSFKSFPDMKSGNSFSTGLSLGYAYTYVLNKKFYVSSSFIPGLGINKVSLERTDSSVFRGEKDLSIKLKFTFGIGYNNSKWFFACMFLSDNYYASGQITPIAISYQISKLRFFVGRRFNAKKTEDKILQKMGIL